MSKTELKLTKARKEYTCTNCGTHIAKGSLYRRWSSFSGDIHLTGNYKYAEGKSCERCAKEYHEKKTRPRERSTYKPLGDRQVLLGECNSWEVVPEHWAKMHLEDLYTNPVAEWDRLLTGELVALKFSYLKIEERSNHDEH